MDIPQSLIDKGFVLSAVTASDLPDYLFVKKHCYKDYVDEYFGGWLDDVQIKMNTDVFEKTMKQSCFRKIMLHNKTVGFFGYDELEDRIGGITIQMLKGARNQGLGSSYLEHLILLSHKTHKPIFLKVFKSNPAQNLYKRFGFEVYDETSTHYLMKYALITGGV